MLNRDSLDYFNDISYTCLTHEDSFELPRRWYHSTSKRARICCKWRNIRLTEEMAKKPEKLEAAVFRSFNLQLVTPQKQLDHKYHSDGFLIDQLQTDVYITFIQAGLKDKWLKKPQDSIHRIANRLSD